MKRKLFCEYGPICYRISVIKENLKRRLCDLCGDASFAAEKSDVPLAVIVKSHTSPLLRRLSGVDEALQRQKGVNIRLACAKIHGLLIRPGEAFSFWRTVGAPTKRHGYVPGLVIGSGGKLSEGVGGGLCQLANLIHWMVLNSPLTVTELHHHSDALFPDDRRRVPFGTGTSVFYNYVDYRFRNDTDQTVQLLLWVEEETLCGELRSEVPFPCRYRLIEENSHFRKEEDGYYRISRVSREVIDRISGEVLRRETVLDNHSRVMYDPKLIPSDEIRDF